MKKCSKKVICGIERIVLNEKILKKVLNDMGSEKMPVKAWKTRKNVDHRVVTEL